MARQVNETLLFFHVLTLLQKELGVLRQKGQEGADTQADGLVILFRIIACGVKGWKLDYK